MPNLHTIEILKTLRARFGELHKIKGEGQLIRQGERSHLVAPQTVFFHPAPLRCLPLLSAACLTALVRLPKFDETSGLTSHCSARAHRSGAVCWWTRTLTLAQLHDV